MCQNIFSVVFTLTIWQFNKKLQQSRIKYWAYILCYILLTIYRRTRPLHVPCGVRESVNQLRPEVLQLVRERDETYFAGAILSETNFGMSMWYASRDDGRPLDFRQGTIRRNKLGETVHVRTHSLGTVNSGSVGLTASFTNNRQHIHMCSVHYLVYIAHTHTCLHVFVQPLRL